MSIVVEVDGVSKSFGDRRVLDNVNLRLRANTVTSLLGPNGAGKTTLIKIITGIYRPSSGEVRWNVGVNEFRNIIGYCPQDHGLLLELSGWDNLLFYGRLYGLSDNTVKERVKELLGEHDIYGHLDRRVEKYSGGMKKMLAITTSLLHRPRVLVLDEPTTGLDPNMRRFIWDIIKDYKNSGGSILLATHYMDEAERLSDHVILINEGKIVAEGSPGELKSKYGPPTIIEIKLSQETSVKKALRLLEEEGYKHYVVDGRITVHVDDPDEETPVLVNLLYKQNARISFLQVKKPSLEDVFVRLTGRRIMGK